MASSLLVFVLAHCLHTLRAQQVVPLEANISTLVFVHALWRHGDRSPSILLPSDDRNPLSSWPDGLGELTTIGVEQEFRLGQWFRRRYNNFVSPEFSPFEIAIRSSDYNRTLMSAYANLAGFFPSRSSRQWHSEDSALGTMWYPIPVHTRPRDDDPELNEQIACPVVDAEYKRVAESAEVRRIEIEYGAFLDFISRNAGYNQTLSLNRVWDVYDPLFCEMMHNETHPWPAWMNASVFAELQRLYDISGHFYYHTPILKRLRGGLLLGEIIERMKWKASASGDARAKMYLYSAHDTTLGVLLAIVNAMREFPRYATVVIIELHQVDGDHVIELFHKNETDEDRLWSLEITDCKRPCTLAKFNAVFASLIPTNWRSECGREKDKWNYADESSYLVMLVVLSLAVVILFTVLVVDRVRAQPGGTRHARRRQDDLVGDDESRQRLTGQVDHEDDDEDDGNI